MACPSRSGAATTDINQECTMSQIPPGLYIGMWGEETYSDVRVRIYINPDATDPGQVYKEVIAHQLVLKAGSTYFKGLLTTGLCMGMNERPTKRAKIEETTQVITLCCDSKEEAIAIEAVLEFLYNHKLPPDPTVSFLCQMIKKADHLGADLCVKACAITLLGLPIQQNSLLHMCGIMNQIRNSSALDPAMKEDMQTALLQAWSELPTLTASNLEVILTTELALSRVLLDAYSDVLAIINNPQKLDRFCMLPLAAIKAWVSNYQLMVDSENSILVLLNKWFHRQPITVQTNQCKKTLSSLVRVALLTPSYLVYALDAVEWFVPPFPDYKLACSVVNKFGVQRVDMKTHPYKKLTTAKRASHPDTKLTLVWRIPWQQIQQAVSTSKYEVMQGPSGYWQGHTFSLVFKVEADSDDNGIVPLKIGIRKLGGSIPGVPASADVYLRGKLLNTTCRQVMFGNTWNTWTVYREVKQQHPTFHMQHSLTDGNHVLIKATIDNVQ